MSILIKIIIIDLNRSNDGIGRQKSTEKLPEDKNDILR